MIVEDHATFREGLKQVILGIENLELIGEAENGKVFLELLKTSVPDIVLMDIMMPEMDGLVTVEKVVEKYPGIKIIVVSGHGEEAYLNSMIQKGISGFLLKSARLNEIEKAIQMVIEGHDYYSQELTSILVRNLRKVNLNRDSELTPQEIRILKMLCKGKSTEEIASELFLSARTVEGHRAKILQKTGQSNTINLLIYALQHKMITQEEMYSAHP